MGTELIDYRLAVGLISAAVDRAPVGFGQSFGGLPQEVSQTVEQGKDDHLFAGFERLVKELDGTFHLGGHQRKTGRTVHLRVFAVNVVHTSLAKPWMCADELQLKRCYQGAGYRVTFQRFFPDRPVVINKTLIQIQWKID